MEPTEDVAVPQPEFLPRGLSTVKSLSLRDILEENNPSSQQPESNSNSSSSSKTVNLASLSKRFSIIKSLSLRGIFEENRPVSNTNEKTMTLAAALAKPNPTSPPPSYSSSSTRTLFDIIEDENLQILHPTDTETITQHVNWKSFKDRLFLRRATSSSYYYSINTPSPKKTLEEVDNPSTSPRVSLMSLLDKTTGEEIKSIDEELEKLVVEEEEEDKGGVETMVHVCCVCMVRHKGVAFIPCGHTFCRLCSRELWVSRGNCPLCNGFILEILDIF